MDKFGRSSMSTPSKGVLYFNQFAMNFLKPYGESAERPDHEVIMRRLHPRSCEWLKRPKIAMSELAETVVQNLKVIQHASGKFLTEDKVEAITDCLKPVQGAFTRLNTRNEQKATGNDVKEVLKRMFDEEDDLPELMSELFKLGGAMYSMATHFFIAKDLFENPGEYADKSISVDQETKDFKDDRTVRGLKNYLTACCVDMKKQSQRTAGAGKKRSLLQQLEDCYDEGCRNEKRRRQRLEEEESEDSSSQDSIIEKPRTRSKENVGQRKRIEPRSDDDDNEEGNHEKYTLDQEKSEKIIIIDESEKQEQGGTPALRPDIAEKKCKDRKEIKLKGSTGSKKKKQDIEREQTVLVQEFKECLKKTEEQPNILETNTRKKKKSKKTKKDE